jgi:hypothetical protein
MATSIVKTPKPLTTSAKLSIAAVVTVLLLSQCVSIGFPTEGVVIDAETKKPMKGVWVSQGWYGTAFCIPIPAPHSSCGSSGRIASAITQSDEQGRFRFARPDGFSGGRWGWFNVHPSFGAITLGYEVDRGHQFYRGTGAMYRWQDRDITIVMTKLTGSRFDVLAKLAEELDHSQYDRTMPGYPQVEQSLFEQMRVIGVTSVEWAEGIKFGFAYRRGELTKSSSTAEIGKVRADIASRAEGLPQWTYEPYTRYVDYLKTQEKP